jgi:hypothetical protein
VVWEHPLYLPKCRLHSPLRNVVRILLLVVIVLIGVARYLAVIASVQTVLITARPSEPIEV